MPPMATTVKGVGAAPGVGVGKIVYFDDSPRFIPTRKISPEDVEGEVRRFRSALKQAEKDLRMLRRQVAQTLTRQDAAIFDAQISILKDPVFVNDVRELIFTEKINVEQALQKVVSKYEKAFDEVLDPAFRERAADIRDVGNRVFMVLLKRKRSKALLQERFVHAALDFLPSRAGDLDKELCAAIVTEKGGKYSHGAILARSLGIPAVVGVEDLYAKIPEGTMVAVDGDSGQVHLDLDEKELQEWLEQERNYRSVEARLAHLRGRPARTKDGERISLMVNIEGIRDLDDLEMDTVDGVGLFRTEFAFMERRNFPSEEEQYEIYAETLRRAKGKRVVFRTLDIGGDKPLEYFRTPQESNPVLGWRGIRISYGMMDLFYTQIRALLRASREGPTSILLPMISTLEEVELAREALNRVGEDLAREGSPPGEGVLLGAMVEVPALAFCLSEILDAVDFVSIGTNDLVQYLLAVDRDNPRVARFYDPYHPAVLRILASMAEVCRTREGKTCSICGEMAGDFQLTMALVGMGYRSFSVAPPFIPRIKLILSDTTLEECREVAGKALSLSTTAQVKEFLRNEAGERVKRYLESDSLPSPE